MGARTHLVGEETQAKHLATMLGNMWREMHEFAAPFYKDYLKMKLEKVEKKQAKLERKLLRLRGHDVPKKEEAEEAKKEEEHKKMIAEEEGLAAAEEKKEEKKEEEKKEEKKEEEKKEEKKEEEEEADEEEADDGDLEKKEDIWRGKENLTPEEQKIYEKYNKLENKAASLEDAMDSM